MDAAENKGEKVGKPFDIGHRCFYFSKEVIQFVKSTRFEIVFSSLFDQLVRASTSIGANVVEGKAGVSRRDWLKYMGIALKSANETKYWLCLIRDAFGYDKEKINAMVAEADELSRIIASIIIKGNK
ncbi:four helix bundle protein [Taibaiella koreensis]|uniref:four helix bundle protein n=1 Tax=Taibaiella koreensis TaxID=1268548 RepID=UPI000E5992D1|nr:four helix bundle protein [Taibaiella koreensis]